MEILVTVLLLVLGVVVIVKGGDLFVDAATWIAEVSGIPTLIVGATVVSVATAMPEILVSTFAAAQGKVDMAIGNAAGSVTANTGLILALSILVLPAAIRRGDYLVKSLILLAASAVVALAGLTGEVSIPVSVLLLAVFGCFLFENVSQAKKAIGEGDQDRRPDRSGKTVAVNLVKFALGTGGIILGADLLVDNASALAQLMGVSERIISVTVVAIGTSLPELVTTLTALAKKQAALSVGNIIGANILNLTLIMPLSALVSGKAMPVTPTGRVLDLPIVLLVSILAFVPPLVTQRFRRWQGAALGAVYAVYLVLTCAVL